MKHVASSVVSQEDDPCFEQPAQNMNELRAWRQAPARSSAKIRGSPAIGAGSLERARSMNKSVRVAIRGMLLTGIGVAILFFASACNKPNPGASKLGLRAAEMFHQGFNDPRSLNFSNDPSDRGFEVVRTASESFMFGGWLRHAYVQDARSKLGQFKNADLKHCDTSHAAVGIFVILTFDSQFERGNAIERLTFLINPPDGPSSADMQGYVITSPLLQGQPNS